MKEEEIDNLLSSFGERVPYPIYLELNKEHSISKKLSKLKIDGEKKTYTDKLKALDKVKNEAVFVDVFQAMAETYQENISYGSKYIQYFHFTGSAFDEILEFAQSQQLGTNALCHLFPYMADLIKLSEINVNEIHLVKKVDHDNTLMLFYTRVVDFIERVSIDPNQIQNEVLKGTYTEFYGVKRYLKQFVDVVVINKKNKTIEIRIDYFKGTSDSQAQKHFSDFFSALKRNMNLSLKGKFDRSKLNIHPVIQKINSDLTGRLVEICFSTKEGSNIKIRKRRADVDIRDEAYHRAGSEAVSNNLDIYRIGSVWKNEKEKELELLIPGSSSLVHTTTKEISEAIITNCRGASDFNFVNNKIFHFLSNNEN